MKREKREKPYAVLLLMKGILARARRSVLAPAMSLSEKCSSAAAMTLVYPPRLESVYEYISKEKQQLNGWFLTPIPSVRKT
jgi:hypothetical protein